MPTNAQELATALRKAAEAHHEYEKTLGKPDPNWPDWYAEFIMNKSPSE